MKKTRADNGRRGGRAKIAKGLATLSKRQLSARGKAAVNARWARAKAQPASPEFLARLRGALETVPYCAKELRAAMDIAPNGDARIVREYLGIRPSKGQTVTSIPCREQTTRQADGSPVAPRIEVDPPQGIEHEFSSKVVGPWRENVIRFPAGWSWRQPGTLGLRIESWIRHAFRPPGEPTEDAQIDLGGATGVLPIRVSNPARKLVLSVKVPEGSPIEWMEPWAWWGSGMEPTAERSVLELGICRSHVFSSSARSAKLEVIDPLPGHVFCLRWRERKVGK